ncbi:MAG: HsmA family protein [Tractidigestivibacter sp.]|jgi:uncharacterized repeat protein (TIGR03987 family)|uniref:HsmA family protein n=1 Tax=Tractidigestivibacter sp. TaxID=2847320 RepID=UPI003D934C32
MSTTLVVSIVAITAALVLYTIGVFWERRTGNLKVAHVVVFWAGLACDTLGTSMMGQLAGGTFQLGLHAVTGAVAIALMAFHAIWATRTVAVGTEQARRNFHRFSIVVWAIWLIPYVSGMVLGMSR